MNDNHFALVIGINEYPEAPKSYKLDGAVNDAQEVEKWLRNPQGGGIKKENCFCLYDVAPQTARGNDEGYPLRYHINRGLNEIRHTLRERYKKSQKPAERFYFYFSGHGQALRMENDNVFMCLGNWGPDSPNANLSTRLLMKEFLEPCLPCYELVLWTDCCRSRVTDIRGGGLDIGCKVPWNTELQSKIFWANATLHETPAGEALDNQQQYSGYFTRALIEGLNSGVNGYGVSWDALRDYLKQRVEGIAQDDKFPQRAVADHNSSDTQLYFGRSALNASIKITLLGPSRNLELLFNAIKQVKLWQGVAGTKSIKGLELGLYKLVDLDSGKSELIDCSSPKERVINDF